MKHNTAGFTLIELMVTVTIIAIVSTVAISPFKMLSDGMDTKERSEHIGDMLESLNESAEK